MIPLVLSDPTMRADTPTPTPARVDEDAGQLIFGDLLAQPDVNVDTIPLPDGGIADPMIDASEGEAAEGLGLSADPQVAEEDMKQAPLAVVDVAKSGAPQKDAGVLLITPQTANAKVGLLPDPEKMPSPTVTERPQMPRPERGDVAVGENRPPRPSVAQTVVEGRLPQSAPVPEVAPQTASPQVRKTGVVAVGLQDPTAENAATRTGAWPLPDKVVMAQPDQTKAPQIADEDLPRNRVEDVLRQAAPASLKSQATVLAATQPPAVAVAQLAVQQPRELAEQALKFADAEAVVSTSLVERHSPAAPSQSTATAAASPETARHAATQIAVAVTNSPGKATEIALNPEELGRVRLNLSAADGAIVLNVLAERPETQDLLRRHMDILAQEFRQLGYTSISFSFGEQKGAAHSSTDMSEDVPEPDLSDTAQQPDILPEEITSGLDVRI